MTKTTLLAVTLASCSFADPPAIIRVVRNSSIQPYTNAKAPVNVLGMVSITGASETWLMELHDTFGSFEDLEKTTSAFIQAQPSVPPDELLASSKSLVAVYNAGLSYRPDQAIQNLAKMRYFDVVVYRIRPGAEADFAKFLKLRGLGLDSINLDRPNMVYQVISGVAGGTYLVLTPLPSLRVLDDVRSVTPAYAEADQAAAKKIASDLELIREHLWFRLDPRVSYVSDDFAYGDSDFWRPAQ
jgi:hypothetical protein